MSGRPPRKRVHPLLPNLGWRLSWYLGRTRIPTPPYYVNIEPNNLCNLRCTLCSMDGSRPGGFMDEVLFRRIVDDAAAEGVTEVRLFLGGEPLLHPRIAEFVRVAEEAGLITCIHTNAVRLDESLASALLDAGLSQISFSFDGESAETYERIRVGARFEPVLGNILRFLEMKKSRGLHLPETTLQMIRPEPSAEAPHRRERGRLRLGRSSAATPPSCVSREFAERFRDLPLDHWLLLAPHNWAGELKDVEERRGRVYFRCQALWQSLSIAWDGAVLLCCGDLNGRILLGNLKDQSIREVWNSPRMMEMRRQHLRSDTPKCQLCSACNAPWRNHHPLLSDLWKLLRGRLV